MCHGAEWEILRRSYEREIARRDREKAEAESREAPVLAPPKPAKAPRNEEQVPV